GVGAPTAQWVSDQPPARAPAAEQEPGGVLAGTPAALPLLPWVVSGRSQEALTAQARKLLSYLDSEPELSLGAAARALATTRSSFEHRAVVVAGDREQLAGGLRALASGGDADNLVRGLAGPAGRTVFVFPGQGSQWAGMALDLLQTAADFAERMAECEQALAPYVDWSLTAVLRGDDGAPTLDRVDVVQPVLFAVMVSLAALWRSA